MKKIFSLVLVGLIIFTLVFSIVSAAKGGQKNILAQLQQEIQELWNAIISIQQPSCPDDMVQVNDYCIDKELNDFGDWAFHVDLCGSEGKRMCSKFEWSYACQLNLPEVEDMTLQHELLNDGQYVVHPDVCGMGGVGGY